MNIFECLKPEYFERVINKPTVSKSTKKKYNKDLKQSLESRMKYLEKLLLKENPTERDLRRIEKIKKRILKTNGITVQTPKKYKNKIVRKLRNKKCPTDYNLYIKSAFWTQRKNQYYQNYTKMCMRCGTKKYVSLHHKFYDHTEFGKEKDEHLCPLCETCHKIFHDKYGVKSNMIKETNLFITEV